MCCPIVASTGVASPECAYTADILSRSLGNRSHLSRAGRLGNGGGGRLSPEQPTESLDATDRRLIAELLIDGRISVRELAERIHVSRAHAYARLSRLHASGIIKGFTATIAHEKAGLKTSAFIAMSIQQDSWRGIAEQLKKLPYIEHFSLVGGDVDVLVLVRARDNHELRHVVLEQLHGLTGVESTKTWLIFEESAGAGTPWG